MPESYDEGPFRNWTAVKFDAGTDTPELFEDGEDVNARYNDCDVGTEEPLGTKVSKFPIEGTYTVPCTCLTPGYRGGQNILEFRFSIPLSMDWPSCLVGASSGAVIDENMPAAPPGWGGGSPGSISDGNCGKCYVSSCYSGVRRGSYYQLTLTFYSDCLAESAAQQQGLPCC